MSQSSPDVLRPARLKYILISLLLLIFVYPAFESGGVGTKLFNLFVSATLLCGVYIVSSKKRHFLIALCLGLPALATTWANTLVANSALEVVTQVFWLLFFLFTALTILPYVLRADKVTREIIFGAISVYLLLGVAWGGVYSLLEVARPGSFIVAAENNPDNVLNMSDFNYYSFTTLTTLGYGDITPVTSRARSLAILEAITGVLYMAVLIATLVGTHVAHSIGSSDR